MSPGIVYRTIVLKFRLGRRLFNLVEGYVLRLSGLVNLAVRGFVIYVPDISRTMWNVIYRRNFVRNFKFGTRPKRWFCRLAIPCTVLRVVNNTRRGDSCAPIVLDLDRGILKLRYVTPIHLSFRLDKHVSKWINERLREDADCRFAFVYLRRRKLCIALIFERKIPQEYVPERFLVIDVNAWNHGIVYAIINKNGKVAELSRRRPNLRKVDTLYYRALKLEQVYGKLKRLGLEHSIKARRIRREAKTCRSKIYRYLRDHVNKLVHELIQKALKLKCKIIIDDVLDTSLRQLKEELLDNGLAKIYLTYLRRFVKLLENQAKWYGIPIEKKRLPSTLCPYCHTQLIENGYRKLKCPRCGREYDRDIIPILHAKEILTMARQ